jgi:hypothetical protein
LILMSMLMSDHLIFGFHRLAMTIRKGIRSSKKPSIFYSKLITDPRGFYPYGVLRKDLGGLAYSVKNMPMAATAMMAAVAQPKIRRSGGLTRFPMTLGLLVSSVTRTISGGASTPLSTAE